MSVGKLPMDSIDCRIGNEKFFVDFFKARIREKGTKSLLKTFPTQRRLDGYE